MFTYENLRFVEVTPEDLPLLMKLRNAPESWSGTRDAFSIQTPAQQEAWYRSLHGEHEMAFMIQDGAKKVGMIRVGNVELKTRSIGLTGLQIFPNQSGKGYGSKAMRGAAVWAIRELGFHRVTAEALDTNVGAQKAIIKAGFTYEGEKRSYVFRSGVWHNFLQYSILEEEL